MTSSKPVLSGEREVFMDILRGFAIFGILIANLTAGGLGWGPNVDVESPFLLPELDKQLDFLYTVFIEGKFYSIFSLLFGWGIALQIKRGENSGTHSTGIVKRRLMFMLLLGTVHMLIWPGDIVLFYAILGFCLLPLRRFSNKTLLITAIILILSPIILYAAKIIWPWVNEPADIARAAGQYTDQYFFGSVEDIDPDAWVQSNSWRDVFLYNISGFFYRFGYLFFVSRIPKVLGMFLLGYVLGRSDFFKNFYQNKKVIYWIIGLGLFIGLPANYFLAYYTSNFASDYYGLKLNGLFQTIAYALGVVPLGMAYTGMLMVFFQTQTGKKILSIFAPVGRMAFTNYIMHSLVCQFVFLGPGLGYGGLLGTFYLTVFGILFYFLQILTSTLWLKYMNYGPAEWVWRSLTYWKVQPMLRAGVVHPD
jgi:uncharacterized protein